MAKQGLEARPVTRFEDGRRVLRVGGVIQSVEVNERHVADVWDAMLPSKRPTSALILGLGGGSIATLMTRRWGALPITGVERDAEITHLARREFGLDQFGHLTIVTADAFAWMRGCRQTFGAICVDLYTAGRLAHGALGAGFLRDIRRSLAPGGEVTYNLWRSAYLEDQIRRIATQLTVLGRESAGSNIIIRATRSA